MFVTLIVAPGLAALELDATLSITHQSEVDVTDHPVEVGANVSDHARAKPEIVTIEGIVTDTPLLRGETRFVEGQGGVTVQTSATADVPAGALGVSKVAYEKLIEMKEARQLVTLATELRTYRNMMLTSLTVPRDASTGDALQFTATFKGVRLAEVRRRQVAVVAREPKAKGKTAAGKQSTKAVDDDTEKSLMYHGKDTDLGTKAFNWLLPSHWGLK